MAKNKASNSNSRQKSSRKKPRSDVVSPSLAPDSPLVAVAVVGTSPSTNASPSPSVADNDTVAKEALKLDPLAKLLFVGLHQDTASRVIAALKSLHKMCCTDDLDDAKDTKNKNRKKALVYGPCHILIALLFKWQNRPDTETSELASIQANAMECLALFLYNNWEGKLSGVNSLGIDAIVWAMQAFPFDDELQVYGLMSLRSAICDEFDIDEAQVLDGKDDFKVELKQAMPVVARRFVDELGGIKVIVDAMSMFPTCMDCQKFGCQLLESFSLGPLFKDALRDGKARSAVANALDNPASTDGIREAADNFMRNMYSESKHDNNDEEE